MLQNLILVSSIALALSSANAWSAGEHNQHSRGMSHGHGESIDAGDTQLPSEGGQATFSALIEIVAMLEADPSTDWSQVDISALREHLLDMNHLILDTSATTDVTGDRQIRFDVLGSDASIASIHRMVPTHSRFVAQSRGWRIEPKLSDTGASVTITVDDDAELARLRALGFYGFMALESHHQAHHFQIVRGAAH